MATDTQKDLLLGGLLYFQPIRDMYVGLLSTDRQYLFDMDNSPYPTLENTLRLYVKADSGIPAQSLLDGIFSLYDRLPPANVEFKEQYYEIVSKLCQKERFTQQSAEAVLKAYNESSVKYSFMERLKQTRSSVEMIQLAERFKTDLSKGESTDKVKFYDPVADMEELLVLRPRVSTGVPFFDTVTGGGITFGDHFGLLAPSGGGKTVISVQLACSLAILGYNTVILQFEQPIAGNITHRIYSFLTGLPITLFENNSAATLPQYAKEALWKVAPISKRIKVATFYDKSYNGTSEGAVMSVIQNIESLMEDGYQPQIVLVDWLGAIVESMMQIKGSQESYPLAASAVQKALMTHGKQKGYTIGFYHQTKMEIQEKASIYKPKKSDAYFFGAFANNLETCITVGKGTVLGDGTQVMYICNGKSRCSAPGTSVVVRMNQLYARMEETKPGEYIIGKGGWFVPAAAAYGTNEPQIVPVSYEPTGLDGFLGNYT